jgi:hypothetical protein
MTYRELVTEARRLPVYEQLQLVEEILRGMRETALPASPPKRRRIIPFVRLRGALRPEGPLPADAELKDAYTNHLLEKYL